MTTWWRAAASSRNPSVEWLGRVYGDFGAVGKGRKDTARFFRIQYLRAVAAFCVVLFHTGYYLDVMRGEGKIRSILPSILGGFGVFLFFVISGYLMAILAQRTAPSLFIVHRIIRIYPIYWVVLLLYYLVAKKVGQPMLLDPMSILLTPGPSHYYVLGVEWTLPFEMTFYLVIFLIILLRLQRALPAIAIVWASGILALAHFHPEMGQDRFPQLASVPISQWTLPFVVGLLIPAAIQRGLPARLGLPVGVICLALVYLIPGQGQLLLTGACFFFVSWAVAPRNPNTDRDKLGWLTKFGDWSYALYLCHVPVIHFTMLRYPKYIGSVAIFVFTLLMTIVVASLIGRLDILLYKRLKGVIDRSPPRGRNSVAAAFLAVVAVFAVYSEAVAAADRSLVAVDDNLGRRLAAGGGDIRQTAELLGYKSDEVIRGGVDSIALDPGGQIRISGWAFDSVDPTRPVSLLFFRDGAYLGAALTDVARPDVDRAFHIWSFLSRRGFSALLDASAYCNQRNGLEIVILAVDGRFAKMIPEELKICPVH